MSDKYAVDVSPYSMAATGDWCYLCNHGLIARDVWAGFRIEVVLWKGSIRVVTWPTHTDGTTRIMSNSLGREVHSGTLRPYQIDILNVDYYY